MRIYVETYGCSANQSDSEIMLGLLKKEGFKIVNSSKESDLNILNTCIVKSPTENRMKHRIKTLKRTGKPLIVAGCMSKAEGKMIQKIAPEASLIGPNSIQNICEAAREALKGKRTVKIKDLKSPKICLPKIRINPVIDIVQVSTGCLGNCCYCQVKFAKGELFSYSSELVVKQIRESLKQGIKEIWLTSQDMGAYGKDIGENLPELLEKIVKIEGKFFVRVGMMNPNHVNLFLEELVESYKSDKIFKFLHLPVQSGSDRILERMNRRYKIDDFRKIVNVFRKKFPKITISTDVIAGFPGETVDDFKQTLRLLEEIKPDVVNVSKYWPRPGTKASKMKQLDRKIINQRTRDLSESVKKIQRKNNKKWSGWEGEVLIDEKTNKGLIGRNYAYKPITTKGRLGEFRQAIIENS
ncbi:MAG: tRNA (N(6)-L-threonylcarbamoyladenosine(37)-C(2))-methylthiotransferase [Candidatus Aenigmarchaeota archaeon]|nr:tRNA (N(6)-L-threonylcarbamoyladenosine(37)-C(2))-methylthiotransferase [Candidatus Aenigmarchaeota archaeon]